MESELLIEKASGVLTLTLNRRMRKNALSPALYDSLLASLDDAERDPAIGVVVLTGAGDTFCAGGDVKRMAGTVEKLSFEDRVARLRSRARISEMLHGMHKPTIAMMRGQAVGAGLSFALACDFRIADTSVQLSTGFMNVGLSGDFGGHYFLPRLVGMARARELYLTSTIVLADEALRIGLVNRVLDPDQLEACVHEMAASMAAGPRIAIGYLKENLNQAMDLSLARMLDEESFRHVRCVGTKDHKEAVAAFVEKRLPVFNSWEE
ncbi:enoyl-CoA hydratase [Allopusillimonas ginsengisoli]|nr:enoyl-CoA hydratase [Allopusillimonas ginsengisoli]